MSDETGTDIGRWASWPPYAGYGDWVITVPEETSVVPGSGDHRINEKLLPATQWALKYLPFSNEITIAAFMPGVEVANVIAGISINFTFTTLGTLDVSYRNWLGTGLCAVFDVAGADIPDSARNFGPVPPTLDYQIEDTFKETVHYGMRGLFLVAVDMTGAVSFVQMEAFFGYLEHVVRSRMKGVRLEEGDISSASFYKEDYDAGGVKRWWYDLSTTLPNERPVAIDLSSSPVNMTIYTIDSAGLYFGTTSVVVDSITGSSVRVRVNAPTSGTSTDAMKGWSGGYFKLDKIVLNQNPLTLYHERKLVATGTIPTNQYVTETSLGYETREQQVKNSGKVQGIYVPINDLKAYLQGLIDDPATATADSDAYKADVAKIDGDTVKKMEEEGLVYGAFEGTPEEVAWGTKLLGYVDSMNAQFVTLHIGIGGGTTARHNFHAGCLTGAYLYSGSDTYRISNHLRKSVLQIAVKSKTSASNLVDQLVATPTKGFEAKMQRMWVMNDMLFGQVNSGGSCEKAVFWGKLLASAASSSSSATSSSSSSASSSSTTSVVLKLSDNTWPNLTTRTQLNNMFLQSLTPTSTTLVKKYSEFEGWRLNNFSGSLSHEITNIVNGSADDELLITLKGIVPNSALTFGNEEWWISFGPLFSTSGYGYISAPYLAMSGALSYDKATGGKGGSRAANAIAIAGLYVSAPFREAIQEKSVLSVVLENGGVYPNLTTPPAIFLSTGKTGTSFSFAQNPYTDSCYLLYRRANDSAMTLCVRRGRLNFYHDLSEHLVYYGDAKYDSTGVTVSGSAGNTIVIDVGNQLNEHDIIGFSCKRSGAIPTFVDPPSMVVWQAYHDGYALGFPCTSGRMYTLYSKRNSVFTLDTGDHVPEYERGNILSGNEVSYDLNVGDKIKDDKIVDKKKIKLVPVYNNALSPMIENVKLFCVPRQNFVTDATSSYIYAVDNHLDVVLYTKNQMWVRTGSGGYSSRDFEIKSQSLVKAGSTLTVWPTFDNTIAIATFDVNQDGLFCMTSMDQLRSFNSGLFTRSSGWTAPTTTSTATPDVSVSEANLYQIPMLVVPNITRCAFSDNKMTFDVVGYSNVKSSSTATSRDVLGLVYYRVNLFNTVTCPIYVVNARRSGGASDQFVFTHPNMKHQFKRIVVNTAVTSTNVDEIPVFTDSGLIKGSLSVASDNNVIVVFSHQSAGVVYFVSTDAGKTWAYFDDVNVATNGRANISSPVVRYRDDSVWFFYMVNQTDLFFKRFNIGKLLAIADPCRGKKSSDIKDTGFITAKSTLQTYLNSCPEKFVAQIPEQQVSFEVDEQRDVLIVYMDSDGRMRGINTKKQVASWSLNPVNF